MKKGLKIISTLFKCIGIGAIVLYIYNSIKASNDYVTLPQEVADSIRLYLIIGIGTIVIGIVLNMIYNRLIRREVEEETKKEINEDQKECKNCKELIAKDSYICPSCGYIEDKESEEKKVEEEKIDEEYINKYYNDNRRVDKDNQSALIRVLPKIFLIIFIVISIYLVYLLSIEDNKNNVVSDKKIEFLNFAISITSKIDTDELDLSGSKVYLTLTDLGNVSNNYDCDDSYIVVNGKEYYLMLSGKGDYSEYSIDLVNIEELNISKVLNYNNLVKDVNDKLLIDTQDKVIIYNRN